MKLLRIGNSIFNLDLVEHIVINESHETATLISNGVVLLANSNDAFRYLATIPDSAFVAVPKKKAKEK